MTSLLHAGIRTGIRRATLPNTPDCLSHICAGKTLSAWEKPQGNKGRGRRVPKEGAARGSYRVPARDLRIMPPPPLRVFTSSSPWTRGQANTLPASGLGLIRMRTLRAGARLARAARGWTPQAGGLQGERVSDDHSVSQRHDPALVPAPWKRPGRSQEVTHSE